LFQIPEENQLNIHYVENGKLSVWFPLLKRHGDISLNEFHEYVLISEEQFEEYKKNPGDVFDYLLVHKNSKGFKESNKANLSAQDFIKKVESNPERSKGILKKLLTKTKDLP
jgi:hypothetical protein